jgi:hypothetical protein
MAEEKRFFVTCGWSGYVEGGATRTHFRFADSHLTGAFKAIGARNWQRPGVDTQGFVTAHFPGVVYVAGDPVDHAAPTVHRATLRRRLALRRHRATQSSDTRPNLSSGGQKARARGPRAARGGTAPTATTAATTAACPRFRSPL